MKPLKKFNVLEFNNGKVKSYVARAPQSFYLRDIIAMHQKAMEEGYDKMIDSASLMIHYGRKLHLVEGPAENIKITTPSDFYIFKAIREARENMQILGI